MSEEMRLDRFLAECNQGTRKEVKELIRKGMITVNDIIVRDSAVKIRTDKDNVCIGSRKLIYEKYRYYMLHKPEGCVTANRDGLSKTVMEFLQGEKMDDLFAVGRLDKDTEGLLLITNDGPLGHALLSPKKHVDKTYLAVVDKQLSEMDMIHFAEGLDIGDDNLTLPAKIRRVENAVEVAEERIIGEDGIILPVYEVVLQEGRFHQVKRMFEACGCHVVYLKRVAMGLVTLDNLLKPGQFRRLTAEEVQALTDS